MDRPAIPEEVKRQLRQEAGFGCCKCGNPIIDYHHIIPWEKEQHFRAEDMMALCPTHHRQYGSIQKSLQYKIKLKPRNINDGYTLGNLTPHHTNTRVIVGTNTFGLMQKGSVLKYQDEDLFSFSISPEGYLLLNLKLYDEQDNLLAEIIQNEWRSHNNFIWDIVHKPYYIKISKRLYNVELEINFKKIPIELKGKLWRNGHKLSFSPLILEYKGNNGGGIIAKNCFFRCNTIIHIKENGFSICS
tara:strand:- start:1989 stop:2720 length:732 start_codon:yes stop_codon:yes gene_type:complete